ncbi:hypothetical protein ACRAWG_33665 [Methylobacterium sp. P31]
MTLDLALGPVIEHLAGAAGQTFAAGAEIPRALPSRRLPHHHLVLHRQPQRRGGARTPPPRTSDLVPALLGVVLLGGFALLAAYALTAARIVP